MNAAEMPQGRISCNPSTDTSSISNFFRCGSWLQLMYEAALCYVEHAQRCIYTHIHTQTNTHAHTHPVSRVQFSYHCHSTMPLLRSPGLGAPDFTALKREYKHEVIILCEPRWKCAYPNIGRCLLPVLLLVCVGRHRIAFWTLHFKSNSDKMPVKNTEASNVYTISTWLRN